jgi:hypothetical protein
MNEDDADGYDFLGELAVAAGFTLNEDGTMEVPDEMMLDELLEKFANIVSEISVKQFVDRMCEDMREGATIH